MTYNTNLLRHFRLCIGRNIHRLRAKRRLPLHKLARMSNVKEVRLDHFEIGKNEIRLDEILRLACALEVQVEDLMANKGQE